MLQGQKDQLKAAKTEAMLENWHSDHQWSDLGIFEDRVLFEARTVFLVCVCTVPGTQGC